MKKKRFSDISITEIIQTAKVARASFYRNYDSKEDVLSTLIEEEICYESTEYYNYQNVLKSFQYFEKYKLYMYIGALYNTAVM